MQANPELKPWTWSLDIWEGFFKPTREGRPSYVRCGPKGLGNLASPTRSERQAIP
jgi:hypothetical protein